MTKAEVHHVSAKWNIFCTLSELYVCLSGVWEVAVISPLCCMACGSVSELTSKIMQMHHLFS